MEDIIKLINEVGFPIVACVFLAFNNRNLMESINNLNLTLCIISDRVSNIEKIKEISKI